MTNTRYTYSFNGWGEATQGTISSSFDRYYTARWYDPWDDEDSFVGRLKDIKWKFDEPFDLYSDFVEVMSGKPAQEAPKLPDSYPKGDLDNLLGFGPEDT